MGLKVTTEGVRIYLVVLPAGINDSNRTGIQGNTQARQSNMQAAQRGPEGICKNYLIVEFFPGNM